MAKPKLKLPKLKLFKKLQEKMQLTSSIERSRDELLREAQLYYEFPMISIANPPGNDYIDYCLVHAQHRNGFEAKTHFGPALNTTFSGSKIEKSFSGQIRGVEIKPKQKKLLSRILFVIFFPIAKVLRYLKKKKELTSIIMYWGINKYDEVKLMDIVQDKENPDAFLKSMEIDGAAEIYTAGQQIHPTHTVMHVSVALMRKKKKIKNFNVNVLMQKFDQLKQIVSEELSMTPIAFDFSFESQEKLVKPLMHKAEVKKRFPY